MQKRILRDEGEERVERKMLEGVEVGWPSRLRPMKLDPTCPGG
jgi:hypothetical protein